MSINLDEIEKAVAVSASLSPAPWLPGGPAWSEIYDNNSDIVAEGVADEDAEFIVLLRNNAHELLRLARIGQATEAAAVHAPSSNNP